MAANPFQKATREQIWLRMALEGPPGSGKTYTSLLLASLLFHRTAVIDTEHGSANRYADIFDFDALRLTSFAPDHYMRAIRAAVENGYDGLIIDSMSHGWSGKDGVLEQVSRITRAAKGGRGGNSFTDGWGEMTPKQNELVETILGSPIHIIGTMRTKMAYETETNDRGKIVPKKIGTKPIQREEFGYEFDIIGDMDQENFLRISKTRCIPLHGAMFEKPGKDLADIIREFIETGERVDVPAEPATDEAREAAAAAAVAADEKRMKAANTVRFKALHERAVRVGLAQTHGIEASMSNSQIADHLTTWEDAIVAAEKKAASQAA